MSTSQLQRYVSNWIYSNLIEYEPRENCRPDWLITSEGERLELDFYVQSLDLAVEIQGAQHYIYVPFFHGNQANFVSRLRRDRFKRETCQLRGIKLYEIASSDEAELFFSEIKNNLSDKPSKEVFIERDDISPDQLILREKTTYPEIWNCNIAELRLRRERYLPIIKQIDCTLERVKHWDITREQDVKLLELLEKQLTHRNRKIQIQAAKSFSRVKKRISIYDNPDARLEVEFELKARREKFVSLICCIEDIIIKRATISLAN